MDRFDTVSILHTDDRSQDSAPGKGGNDGQDENQTDKGGTPFPKQQDE